jgi:hypothetical protein
MDLRLASGVPGLPRLELERPPFALLERAAARTFLGPDAGTDYDDLGHGALLLLTLKLCVNSLLKSQ